MIEPQPVAQKSSGDAAKRASSPARSRSPRSLTAASAAASTMASAAAAPTAIVKALLLNVPPWVSPPPRAGSKAAIRSARPPKAPNDRPPARYLPSVVMSGVMPSSSWAPPSARRDVITSSKISTAPASAVSRRSVARNAGSPGMQPPDPSIGSTSTQATSVPLAANSASAAATSLYGSTA